MTLKGKKRLIKRLRAKADAIVQLSAEDLYKRILRRTPVQTSRLAASWTISLDEPKGKHVVYARKGDLARAKKANLTRAKSAKAGDILYISTRQPYAMAVEYGDEHHKPRAMVRLAVAEAEPAFRRIVAEAIRRER